MIEHEQVIGNRIKLIVIPPARRRERISGGSHFHVEHPVSQRLDSLQLGPRARQPYAQVAGTQLREHRIAHCGSDKMLGGHRAGLSCRVSA